MWHLCCPDYNFCRLTDIDGAWLAGHGIESIILDVDNTLVPFDGTEASAAYREWLKQVAAQGIRIVLLSNNGGSRLAKISTDLGLPAVSWAVKPLPLGFKRALHQLSVREKKHVLVIGDQLLTDVLGAKILGLQTLWVESLGQKEFAFTRLTRTVERRVIKKLKQRGLWQGEKK